MANLSSENIARLRDLVHDGVRVMQDIEDLKVGLRDTIKDVAEQLDVKPTQLNRLIKMVQGNKMNDFREASEELEELYKAAL